MCVAAAPAAAAAPADGTPLLDEAFTGPSVANPNVIPLNDACLPAATEAPPAGSSTPGVCNNRDGTPDNDATGGWLRLTDEGYNRRLTTQESLRRLVREPSQRSQLEDGDPDVELRSGGTPFLPPLTENLRLDLVETKTFGSRVIYERYARSRDRFH